MTRFDWASLMQAAVDLGVGTEAFWRLTPAELGFLLGRGGGAAPLSRARLEELAAAFPDDVKGRADDRT